MWKDKDLAKMVCTGYAEKACVKSAIQNNENVIMKHVHIHLIVSFINNVLKINIVKSHTLDLYCMFQVHFFNGENGKNQN